MNIYKENRKCIYSRTIAPLKLLSKDYTVRLSIKYWWIYCLQITIIQVYLLV